MNSRVAERVRPRVRSSPAAAASAAPQRLDFGSSPQLVLASAGHPLHASRSGSRSSCSDCKPASRPSESAAATSGSEPWAPTGMAPRRRRLQHALRTAFASKHVKPEHASGWGGACTHGNLMRPCRGMRMAPHAGVSACAGHGAMGDLRYHGIYRYSTQGGSGILVRVVLL